jgi:hypothetical protein
MTRPKRVWTRDELLQARRVLRALQVVVAKPAREPAPPGRRNRTDEIERARAWAAAEEHREANAIHTHPTETKDATGPACDPRKP